MAEGPDHPAELTKKFKVDIRDVSPSLWAGVLGAPALWGLQLQIGYTLAPWACRHHKLWLHHLVTLLFLAGAVGCLMICWQERRRVPIPAGVEDDKGGRPGRSHFLSILGILTCLMFVLVIFAQGLASFFIDPCWD
jgi:hypothetical protein